MLAPMLWASLALAAIPQGGRGAAEFVELHDATEPRLRAEGVFAVRVASERYDVLTRAGAVAALEIDGKGRVVPREPSPSLSPALRPGETWVVSPRWTRAGIASVDGSGANRITKVTIAGEVLVSVPGVYAVRLVEGRDRVLFARVGRSPDEPRRFQLVDAGRQQPLLDFTVEHAGAARVSADGDTVVVAGAGALEVHRAGRDTLELPPCRSFHVLADGERVVCSDSDGVFLMSLAGPGSAARVDLSTAGPLIAAADVGGRLLLEFPDAAELYELAAAGQVQRRWRHDAPRGARFVSCNLRATARGLLAALGARRKVWPQLEPVGPSAPARAEGSVLVLDGQGTAVLDQVDFPTACWEGDQPRVLWTAQGRLLVVTRDRVLASRTVFP